MTTKIVTFWIRYWFGHSKNRIDEEKYEFYDESWKFTEEDKKDEERWKAESENWAQQSGGWMYDRYDYGYEFVDHPPKEWFEKEIAEARDHLIFLLHQYILNMEKLYEK